MAMRRLKSAMDQYVEALAAFQLWDLSGEECTQQQETVHATRLQLLEAIDDAAAEALGVDANGVARPSARPLPAPGPR